MRRLFSVLLLAVCLLAGCSPLALAPSSVQPALPFTLVTAAPNASPTPTPFQPIPWTPTGTIQAQPTIDAALPTATLPAATQTEIPTIDPNLLVNSVATIPTSLLAASLSPAAAARLAATRRASPIRLLSSRGTAVLAGTTALTATARSRPGCPAQAGSRCGTRS